MQTFMFFNISQNANNRCELMRFMCWMLVLTYPYV